MRGTLTSFRDCPLCGRSLAVAGRAFPSLPILSMAVAERVDLRIRFLTYRHVGLVRFSGSFTLNKLECLKQALWLLNTFAWNNEIGLLVDGFHRRKGCMYVEEICWL